MKFRNTGIIKSFNIGADGIRMPEVYYTILEASEKQNVYFTREGILTDHRGDPAYSSWDEELTAYDKLVEEMEGISFYHVQKRVEKERKEEKEKAKEE